MLPWTKKYEPKCLEEIKGQDNAVRELNNFISNFSKQKKKAALVYGPTGCGKTAAATVLANYHNLELIEINASDFRNRAEIEAKIGNSIKQRSLFFREKLVLIDEIEGFSGTKDRGGIPTIAGLIESSSFPVIMIVTDPWDQKFSQLRSKSLIIEFRQIDFDTVYDTLKNICEKEGTHYNDKALRSLARYSGGDLRAAINDLQSFSHKKSFAEADLAELPERHRIELMQNALLKIFKGADINTALAALENTDENIEKIILWLDENLPQEYTSDDLAGAYQMLSRADVFRGRIIKRQHWRFLTYAAALAGAGICASKSQKNRQITEYKPTLRILKLWRANIKHQKKKAIAEKLALATHCSLKTALKNLLPYLHFICQHSQTEADKLAAELCLDDEEISWLRN